MTGLISIQCFLTVPAIIYLTMTPRFPRTRRFANPYATVTVDIIFTILWLSAFSAVANWNGSGRCHSACRVSRIIVVFGVLIWYVFPLSSFKIELSLCNLGYRLLWTLAAAMSIYGTIYFRREGYLPGASRAPHNASMIDPDKEAFSTAPHDEYAPVHDTDDNDIHDAGPSYSRTHLPSYSNGGHGRSEYVSPHVQDENSAYEGYSAHGGSTNGSTSGRVRFPDGRYDNVGVFGDR